jgi:hypothetical protein
MFLPPDTPEPDRDALVEEMFDRYEKCGYAVIPRDEWRSKLDEAAREGYAEGRKDERADVLLAIKEAGFDLTEDPERPGGYLLIGQWRSA